MECITCRVSLTSEDARSHYQSAFHSYNLKLNLADLTPLTFAEFSGERTIKVDFTLLCIFCSESAESISGNLSHMQTAHGFFVPEAEHVRDLKGLLRDLHGKVREDFKCIMCDWSTRHGPRAVQQHMIDTQHVFMNIEDIDKYYDDSFSFELLSESSDYYLIDSDSSYSHIVVPRESPFTPVILPTEELKINNKILGHKKYLRYYRQYFRNKRSRFIEYVDKKKKVKNN